ncbi:MAG: hypothetical protein GY714_13485 [Desulfobacterales bacterium]|nr:hypothetical protein [Desulfobacterales bacterium]
MKQILENCLKEVKSCTKCSEICEAIGSYGKDIALDYITPKIPSEIVFVAESPPSNKGNFFYNKQATDTRFRNRLFKLINLAGLGTINSIDEFNSKGYYLADTINCRWNKNKNESKQPSPKELDTIISNCTFHLKNQLEILKPKSIVFIGKVAEKIKHSEELQSVINSKIVEMPFILTAPVKTEVLVEKLSELNEL